MCLGGGISFHGQIHQQHCSVRTIHGMTETGPQNRGPDPPAGPRAKRLVEPETFARAHSGSVP